MGGPQTSKPRSSGSGPAADESSEPGVGPEEAPAVEPETPSGREYVAPRSVPVGLQPQKDDAPKIVLNLPEAAGPAGEREVEVARARRRSATVKVSRSDVTSASKAGSRDEPTMVTGRQFEAPPELFVDLPSSPPPALVSSGSRGANTRPPPRERTSKVPLVLFALIGVAVATGWFVTNGGSELPGAAAPPTVKPTSTGPATATAAPTAAGQAARVSEPEPAASALVLATPPVSAGELPAGALPSDSPGKPGEMPPSPPEAAAGTVKVGPGVTGLSGQAPATTQWVAPPRPPSAPIPRTAKPPTGKPPGDIPTSI